MLPSNHLPIQHHTKDLHHFKLTIIICNLANTEYMDFDIFKSPDRDVSRINIPSFHTCADFSVKTNWMNEMFTFFITVSVCKCYLLHIWKGCFGAY